jgi:DNA-binding response OmpR family regulator
MVLVADDDPMLSEVLRAWLEREGYPVEVCHDGEKAYERVRDPRCRCLVLDIQMPRLNGAELLMLMQGENLRVPVIVVAGFPDFEEKEMKNFRNVVKFFPKPFDMRALLEEVRKHAGPPPVPAAP